MSFNFAIVLPYKKIMDYFTKETGAGINLFEVTFNNIVFSVFLFSMFLIVLYYFVYQKMKYQNLRYYTTALVYIFLSGILPAWYFYLNLGKYSHIRVLPNFDIALSIAIFFALNNTFYIIIITFFLNLIARSVNSPMKNYPNLSK